MENENGYLSLVLGTGGYEVPLVIWWLISASGGTEHPREKLGQCQGSTCLGYGAGSNEKAKAREKTGLWPDSRAEKQARRAVLLSEPRMRGTISVTVSENSNRALEE